MVSPKSLKDETFSTTALSREMQEFMSRSLSKKSIEAKEHCLCLFGVEDHAICDQSEIRRFVALRTEDMTEVDEADV